MMVPSRGRKVRLRQFSHGYGHACVESVRSQGTSNQIFPDSLTRTVIKESDTKYRLTGINILNHSAESPYYTPNDPEMARIGGRKGTAPDQVGNEDFTEFYGTSIGRQPSQYKGKVVGYIIHASCWVLFNQVEGLKLKEAKLAKLVQVCRKHWRKNTMWRLYDNNVRFVQPLQDLLQYEYGCDIYQNPLVPKFQQALDCADVESLEYLPGPATFHWKLPF